jgi:hypothetical protein
VAQVLVQFTDRITGDDGRLYVARACGAEMPDDRWQGWLEFLPEEAGTPVRTGRETTQPTRLDTEYWATGLTQVYLEGALKRALHPYVPPPDPLIPPPRFDGPADEVPVGPPYSESILDPFSIYRKGEALLRSQLAALAGWHLVNIIRAHGLSELDQASLMKLPDEALIEIIVNGVIQHAAP